MGSVKKMEQRSGNSQQPAQDKFAETERTRADQRRANLNIGETKILGKSYFGLTLSGGGIRSATFSLGVLQAFAKAPAPPFVNPTDSSSAGPTTKNTPLLKIFD